MSAHNDTRSPSTDALETLGMIHFKPEKRDAIHLAVEPVRAVSRLSPGQRIGIINGVAYPAGSSVSVDGVLVSNIVPYQGIVDPFLTTDVMPDDDFWFVMKPREVRSLRHVWEAEGFPLGE